MRVKLARARFPSSINSVTARTESGNRDFTAAGAPMRSNKGAMYRMQVLPSTARDPGFGVAPAAGNTPAEYNRVGRDYLSKLHQRYGGDLARMWGAYVWGPGNLEAAIAKHGADWLKNAPQEVRNYVSANIAALRNQ